MSKTALNSEHFYKAGARLARSGGSQDVALAWVRSNGLTTRQMRKVMEGFGEERAQVLMAGSVVARSGRPFGRI